MHNVWDFRLLFGWNAMPNAWILHNIVDGNNDDFLGVFSIENNRYFVYLFCLSCAPKRWGYWIFFFWANCLLLLLHRFLLLAWYFKRLFYFCQYSLQCRNCFPFLVAKKFCASICYCFVWNAREGEITILNIKSVYSACYAMPINVFASGSLEISSPGKHWETPMNNSAF